jgi:cytochrome bd-type quinol oxidase subunit 2
MPETRLGKWAAWFLLAGVVLLAMLILAYNTEVLGDVFEQRTVGGLALWVATAISVFGALVTGSMSRLRHKDRSLVVILATIYGVLATTLLAFGAIPQN